MRDDIRIYLNEGKYSDAVLKCKELLALDNNNPDLWYSLFLSENGNYINTDFNNLNDELAFNKALENSRSLDRGKYESEYNLYRDFEQLKELSILFRYNQMNDYEKVYSNIDKVDDTYFEFKGIDLKQFYDGLYYITASCTINEAYNINILLLNILYLKTNDDEVANIINELIKNQKDNMALCTTSIINSFELLISKFEYIKNNKVNKSLEDSINNLEKLIELNLSDGNVIQAKENVTKLLDLQYDNAMAYVYLMLIDLGLKKFDELRNIDFTKNNHYKHVIEFADDKLKNKLLNYYKEYSDNFDYRMINSIESLILSLNFDEAIDQSNQLLERDNVFIDKEKYRKKIEEIKYLKGKHLLDVGDYENAITMFESISSYKSYFDSVELIEKCKYKIISKKYTLAKDYIEIKKYTEAISILEELGDFQDSVDLIEICKNDIKEISYINAKDFIKKRKYLRAIELLKEIEDYKDSQFLILEAKKKIRKNNSDMITKTVNIFISIISFALMVIMFLCKKEILKMDYSNINLVFSIILLVLSFGIPKDEKSLYKFFLTGYFFLQGYILYIDINIISILSIVGFIIVSSIRQKKFNGTVTISFVLSTIIGILKINDLSIYSLLVFFVAGLFSFLHCRLNENVSNWFLINFGICILMAMLGQFILGYYKIPYMTFDFIHHISIDLLGISVILIYQVNKNNSIKFANICYFIYTILSIVYVIIILLNVFNRVYDNEFNVFQVNFYWVYIYLIVPIIICLFNLYIIERNILFKILGVPLFFIALLFALKIFSALTGSCDFEGCGGFNDGVIIRGCTDGISHILYAFVQLVFTVVYSSGALYLWFYDE